MNSNSWYHTRKKASIPVKTRSLIICCGEQTEVNYFKEVTNFLKNQAKSFSENFDFLIVPDPSDPLTMANNAVNLTTSIEREQNIIFNHVWIVFDKDDFPAENFNNAIKKITALSSTDKEYHPLWSNQCIELWFLLHFIDMHSSISRRDYVQKLEQYLCEKYKKNDLHIFGKIIYKRGRVAMAVRYAKNLIKDNITPSQNDPATKVYEFFEFYSKYLGILYD